MSHPQTIPEGSQPAPLFGTLLAAQSVANRTAPGRRAQILRLLEDRGPLTVWELAGLIGVASLGQISGRLTELSKDGLIEPLSSGGQTLTKPNPATGCKAVLWKLRTATFCHP